MGSKRGMRRRSWASTVRCESEGCHLHTLLEGLREVTISECTFGVLRVSLTNEVTALKTADNNWVRDRI